METVKGPDSSPECRLTRLVDQYQAVLLQMCFMYLHDRTMAEDAVQETFLKAYRSMAAFRGECSEKTYAIMGHEDTWTPEQRVWWNGIVTMYGDDGATDTLIVPTTEVLSAEEAISIARAVIQEVYGFDDAYMSRLHPVANLYTTDERPDYKRWDVQLKKYREGSNTYVWKVLLWTRKYLLYILSTILFRLSGLMW